MYHFLTCENSTCSAGPEGESLEECFSDIPAYVLSRLSLTAGKSCFNGSETESCQSFQSGMMYEPSTGSRGEDLSISYARASHVKELAPPELTAETTERLWALTAEAQSFGSTFRESLSKLDIQICLSKIPAISSLKDFAESFQRLMPLGMSANGVCWGLATSGPIMKESVCGSRLPTPTAHNCKEGAYPAEFTRNTKTLAAQIGGKINPDWNEWRMGWPIKWTDLNPLGMDKILSWRQQHGGS